MSVCTFSAISQVRRWRVCTEWPVRTWRRWRRWCSALARPPSPLSSPSPASWPLCEGLSTMDWTWGSAVDRTGTALLEVAPPAAHRLESHVAGVPSRRRRGRGTFVSVKLLLKSSQLIIPVSLKVSEISSAPASRAAERLWILHFVDFGGLKSAEEGDRKKQPWRHLLIYWVHGGWIWRLFFSR